MSSLLRLCATILTLAVLAAPSSVAFAAEPEESVASEGAPEPVLGTRLEVRAGFGAPLGTLSGALVLQPTPVFAIGAGAGATFGEPDGGPYLQVGGFVRANVLRRSRFTLGPVVTFSGGKHGSRVQYDRGSLGFDGIEYIWAPGFRLDAGGGGEVAIDRLSFRLEAGLGFYLNAPKCVYQSGPGQPFVGACDAPQIEAPHDSTFDSGRLVPYLSLAVGYNSGRRRADETAVAGAAPEKVDAASSRTDSGWIAPTALTVPAGSVTVSLYEAVLTRVTIGLTDRIQIWGGTSWTGFVGAPVWEVGAKATILSVGRLHLALLAEHLGARFSQWNGFVLAGAGAAASVCIDGGCRSVLSVSALGGRFWLDTEDADFESRADALVSPSAVIAIGDFMKIVVESHVPVASHRREAFWAAVARVPLAALTLDLGLFSQFRDFDPVPAGTIAYRW
jgi:hypothetical protein